MANQAIKFEVLEGLTTDGDVVIGDANITVNTNKFYVDGTNGVMSIGQSHSGNTQNAIEAAANVVAPYFFGNGSQLTNVNGSAVGGLSSSQFLRSDEDDEYFGTAEKTLSFGDVSDPDPGNHIAANVRMRKGSVTLVDDQAINFGTGSDVVFKYLSADEVLNVTGGNTVFGAVATPILHVDTTATRVGVNTAPGAYALHVNGNSRIVGALSCTGDVTAFASSDQRLKENITPITDALSKLDQINGYEYDWIPFPDIHQQTGHAIGVIAQEIEEIQPTLVETRENGFKAVDYQKLSAFLISVCKALKAEIDALKNT